MAMELSEPLHEASVSSNELEEDMVCYISWVCYILYVISMCFYIVV